MPALGPGRQPLVGGTVGGEGGGGSVVVGGGVKGGYTHGSSDDLGFSVAEKKVHVHDLQATILHLLGFDHTRLTFRFQGRDYRLTDVHGELVHKILA